MLSPVSILIVTVLSGVVNLAVLIGWLCHEARPADRPRYGYRFLTVAAFLGALGHAFRGLVYGMGWAHQTALLQFTPTNVAFLGLGILALPCLSIRMVMLAHDRMAERLERMANIDELTYTFSAGVEECRDGDEVAFLMARADAALYSAKALGRNRVVAALSSREKPAGDPQESVHQIPSRRPVSG